MTSKAKSGFTLVEMLCAIIVLMLVGMLMVSGVRLSLQSFAASVSRSEAQVLCSTLKTAVSDELRYAGTLKQEPGQSIGFFSQNYGEAAFAGFSSDENGQVLLGGKKLLPSRAYPYGLRAQVALTAYDPDTRIFSVEITVQDSGGTNTLAQTQFEVRQLNEPPSSTTNP